MYSAMHYSQNVQLFFCLRMTLHKLRILKLYFLNQETEKSVKVTQEECFIVPEPCTYQIKHK